MRESPEMMEMAFNAVTVSNLRKILEEVAINKSQSNMPNIIAALLINNCSMG